MIVMELTAAVDLAGTLQTFYLATDAFVTGPADTPPHTSFWAALTDPGTLGVHAYADASTTGGGTKLEAGEVVLPNADGQFDSWLDYSFDGRPVVIREGAEGDPYPGGFTTLFQGTVESLDGTWRTMLLRLRDKQYLFDLPVLTNKYLGNNPLPLGLEGVAADLKDQLKPKCVGYVLQVTPKMVNTSKLTYQVSDGTVADIPVVQDRGILLTKGANFATGALMIAAVAPTAGTYTTCFAEGYFRLGATPDGQITADVVQGATAADRTVAQVLKTLALASGLDPAEVSADDVAALDAVSSAVVGVWLDGEITYQSAMDNVAASLGAWYGFDTQGVMRMGVLTEPAGAAALDLHDYDFASTIERRAARDNNIPVWKVTLEHTKLWTTQTDLAGAVPATTKSYMSLETRKAVSQDVTVQTQFKLATTLTVAGLLTDATSAATEAARQLALHKVRRDIFEVTISTELLPSNGLTFMDVVSLTVSRFGLDSGKLFRLIGIRYQLAKRQVVLTLWG